MYPQSPVRARRSRLRLPRRRRTAATGPRATPAGPWTIPRADRHFVAGLRRLTRVHVRSVEQPVNLDDGDDVYNWPWLYAVEVGHWNLTDAQAKKLREYLLRGGFFMCDDFRGADRVGGLHGQHAARSSRTGRSWSSKSTDAIFHTIYDLDDRYQVPGAQYLSSAASRYKCDGCPDHWRGIYRRSRPPDGGDVPINMDLGDSWEWADDPQYPEKFSALGIRIGVNYVVYAMTH